MRIGRAIACVVLLAWAAGAAGRSPELQLAAGAAAPADRAGVQTLGNAYFYRPAGMAVGKRPLLVLFHGAGQSARAMLDGVRGEADRCGCLLLSVQSAGATWDSIRLVREAAQAGRASPAELFGPDAGRVEQALAVALRAADADRRAVVLAGFSDGASYALSLGLANPALVRGVVAIAPGFHLEPAAINPKQRLFVAHSPTDRVLSFDRSRDAIAASLRRAGFVVNFRAFEGGHRIDRAVLAEGVDFVLGRESK